ncbi:MAG: hypothetical protein JOY64_22770 [Alphaproteobacteria bacterium]|nr:hypothetical protein [Alphaproteobacteria bacterium]MBV8410468.1 hypothetical protein [Alphaproteobacteria bacterium]
MPAGRPAAYKPEYIEIAREICGLGATNETLAERFAVSRRTVDRWIAGIPDFRDAVADGREIANGKVVSALFARATGMHQKMTKVFCHAGQPLTVDYTVELPPDVRACMFWLRNRLPEQWCEGRRQAADDGLGFEVLEEESRRVAERNRSSAGAAAPNEDQAQAALREAAERLEVHL